MAHFTCKMPSDSSTKTIQEDHPSTATTKYLEPGYFQFPFTPYEIQVEFMQQLYCVLNKGGVGIFESPTGTGKSLSLICGALTWLRDYNYEKCQKELEITDDETKTESETTDVDSSEPAWVNEVASRRAKKKLQDETKAKQEQQERYVEKLSKLRKQNHSVYKIEKRKYVYDKKSELDKTEECSTSEMNDIDDKEDAELVLDEYRSDDDNNNQESTSSDEEDLDEVHITKIFYCSRTHSQLDQFVKEVKKSSFGDAARVVSLGSRLNLCINEDVKKLRSITRVNDRCLELQKLKKGKLKKEAKSHKRSKSKSGCPFYDSKRLQDYKDLALANVRDVEELLSLGEEMEACPYYGERYAIPNAELVVLPYNMLLHQATREACGIQLKGNIVVIDEAHNLIETISNIHSVEITALQISRAHSHLLQYRDRYGSRLKAKNLMYVKQILQVLTSLLGCFDRSSKTEENAEDKNKKPNVQLLTINDFLFRAKMDNVNLFKIKRYCERSMISKKLNGFVDKYSSVLLREGEEISGSEDYVPTTSPLRNIENFLECLTNTNKDGRIFLDSQALLSHCTLKFLLLNPAVYFKSVVEEAKAVVVAGGTMQPVSEFKQQLLYSCSITPDEISEFSCGHVIPKDHLLPIALTKGPSGVVLDFTYQHRGSKQMVSEISRLLINLCAVIPAGLVCFFPSYDYKEKVVKQWNESGAFHRIDAKKKIFSEPRKASHVEQTLAEYGNFIKLPEAYLHLSKQTMISPGGCIKGTPLQSQLTPDEARRQECRNVGRIRTQSSCTNKTSSSPNGAILLCVVGGKMSEGINFSDDLGRCVVVVGLPYPNIHSPELKEYVAYLEATLGSKAGKEHCENVCMKAVNQSIGRAIRHINDYSTIVLLDQRYARSSVQNKLPRWISSGLQTHTSFGPAFGALRKFFLQRPAQTKNV